jgi:hypothetical protein
MHTYIHTYIHTHACIHTYTHTGMHTYIHTYILTIIRVCIHTYTNKHTHTLITMQVISKAIDIEAEIYRKANYDAEKGDAQSHVWKNPHVRARVHKRRHTNMHVHICTNQIHILSTYQAIQNYLRASDKLRKNLEDRTQAKQCTGYGCTLTNEWVLGNRVKVPGKRSSPTLLVPFTPSMCPNRNLRPNIRARSERCEACKCKLLK